MAQLVNTTTPRPRLHGSGTGYFVGDEWFEGFADRPEMPERDRALIAEWAARFTPEEVGDEQRVLLSDRVAPPKLRTEEIEDVAAAIRDAEEDLPQAVRVGLYGLLTEDELEKVRFPSRTQEVEGRNYPLGVTELAKLTGATPRQIRHWDDAGLLPGHRVANQRRFYSAAAVHAFALRRLEPYQVAVLGLIVRGDQKLGGFLPLLGSALAFTARRVTGEAGRELTRGAELVARYGGSLAAPAEPRRPASSSAPRRRSGTKRHPRRKGEMAQANERLYLVRGTTGSGKSHFWHLRENPRGDAIGRFQTQREAKEFVAKNHSGVAAIEIRSDGKTRTVRVQSRSASRNSRIRPRRARGSRSRSTVASTSNDE
jgi:hypothetical protein